MSPADPEPGADPTGPARASDLQHGVAGELDGIALVPAGGVFEGRVAVQGDTRIEGTVRGAVRGHGRLELGPEARIEGRVECAELRSQGAIVGPILAHERVWLGAGATVDGDLEAPRLAVEDGARWTGDARVTGG